MCRNDFELFDNAQYPEHFLRLLGLQGIEKFLNRTLTLFGPIEDNSPSHHIKLTCKLTNVNEFVMFRITESASGQFLRFTVSPHPWVSIVLFHGIV